MVDMVVQRAELRETLIRVLSLLRDKTPVAEVVTLGPVDLEIPHDKPSSGHHPKPSDEAAAE